MVAEVGDLSGKHGQLSNGTAFSYADGQVQLSGPHSVLGRSIVIHGVTPTQRISCCTIVEVPEGPKQVTASCDIDDQLYTKVTGSFDFDQMTQPDGTTVDIALDSPQAEAQTYHIHEYGSADLDCS